MTTATQLAPTDAEIEALWNDSRHNRFEVLSFARAVLAKWGTQPQAGAVPQGWKAVPVNPTPEMWKAAKTVPDPNPPYPPHYGLVWDAMLAASPTPPAEQQAAPKAAPGEPSAFPMTGDEEESDLGQWQPGTAKPNMDGTYLREFDEGEATSEFHQGVWLRDGFFPSELQDVRWRGRAAPQQEAQEPVAWYVTGGSRLLDEDEAKAEVRRIGGTARAMPLYTTPQPTHARAGAVPLSAGQYNILVEDLSEWSRHVEVDTAPRSLEEHIHQVFAIHGIKGGQHGAE